MNRPASSIAGTAGDEFGLPPTKSGPRPPESGSPPLESGPLAESGRRPPESSLGPDEASIEALLDAARDAGTRAYAPYSRFHVGAAVLADDGRVFTAANVENASYGLTSCAERNAVFAAVSAGVRTIVAVAIHTPTGEPVSPCGACRQVLFEFGPSVTVTSCCDGDGLRRWSIGELLPGAFGPASL